MRGAQSRHGGLEFNYYVYILRTADRQLCAEALYSKGINGSSDLYLILKYKNPT